MKNVFVMQPLSEILDQKHSHHILLRIIPEDGSSGSSPVVVTDTSRKIRHAGFDTYSKTKADFELKCSFKQKNKNKVINAFKKPNGLFWG